MKNFLILYYSMLFVTFPYMGEHPEHPEHPSNKTTTVTVQAVGKAVADFIASDAKLKGGKFLVFDGKASEALQLDLLKIHMDRLTGLGNDIYFACADFQASNGKIYDLDIFMNGKSADELDVTEIVIHKEAGVQRYGWQEKDGVWVKTTD